MTDKLLAFIGEKYPLHSLDVGEFATLKANGMTFTVEAYHAQGLGHVSVMRAKGFFGLMRMDTLMIVPQDKDLPLYSYDRIYAMGNDTLIVELYDTMTAALDLSALNEVKARYAHLAERDPGEHWYDSIKLAESISKKGKKADTPAFDAFTTEHFHAYLNASAADVLDAMKKQELSARYVNGLLSQGGPSTDVFKKALGEDKTARLFKTVLFGVEI
jgi:hypothetical protein